MMHGYLFPGYYIYFRGKDHFLYSDYKVKCKAVVEAMIERLAEQYEFSSIAEALKCDKKAFTDIQNAMSLATLEYKSIGGAEWVSIAGTNASQTLLSPIEDVVIFKNVLLKGIKKEEFK